MGRVGFIGLGCMGHHMARNLVKRGVNLVVFDANNAALKPFESDAVIAKNPAELASQCSEIITMLPNGSDVYSVFTQKNGIIEGLQPDSLCMDNSTIEQTASVKIADLVGKKQAHFVDAPVSGGIGGAEKATLTFMIGGDKQSFLRANNLCNYMGKNVIHCGDKVGNGLAAKICNNMLVGVHMIAVAEAMNLGVKMGLNPKTLASIINTSSGRCWSSDTYNPVPGVMENVPCCNDYEGGFRCALMYKDLALAQNASKEAGSPTPMGEAAHKLYENLSLSPEYKDKDFGVVYKYFQKVK
ncbi:NAD binding domain of 6-phosphogluconate dehydrogenase domain-containing protein [Ditylenchus destructor]|nr:NAD binding domain of 6-phosphogluconate dehydrogenase domain-containing protein [Ditylenchus destructor]